MIGQLTQFVLRTCRHSEHRVHPVELVERMCSFIVGYYVSTRLTTDPTYLRDGAETYMTLGLAAAP
jgi:hypothetical protein